MREETTLTNDRMSGAEATVGASTVGASADAFATRPGQTLEACAQAHAKESFPAALDHAEAEALRGAALPEEMASMIDFYEEVQRYEMLLILRALELARGHHSRPARMLNLKITTLNSIIKRYGIEVREAAPAEEATRAGETIRAGETTGADEMSGAEKTTGAEEATMPRHIAEAAPSEDARQKAPEVITSWQTRAA